MVMHDVRLYARVLANIDKYRELVRLHKAFMDAVVDSQEEAAALREYNKAYVALNTGAFGFFNIQYILKDIERHEP